MQNWHKRYMLDTAQASRVVSHHMRAIRTWPSGNQANRTFIRKFGAPDYIIGYQDNYLPKDEMIETAPIWPELDIDDLIYRMLATRTITMN